MAGIEEYLNKIKNAVYGREVRQAIHDGIHQCYEDGKAGATDLIARENITQVNAELTARIDELIAPSGEAPSAAEVTDARIGNDGVVYSSLGTAIRKQVGDIDGVVVDLKPIEIIPNSYVVKADGSFASYNGWSRTDYIEMNPAKTLWIQSPHGSSYNACYDENKAFIRSFAFTEGTFHIEVPANTKYVIFSGDNACFPLRVYTEIEKPYQDSFDSLVVTSKPFGLVPLSGWVMGSISSSNGRIVQGWNRLTSDFVPVSGGASLDAEFSNSVYGIYISEYDSNRTFLGRQSAVMDATRASDPYSNHCNVSPNTAYIRITAYRLDSEFMSPDDAVEFGVSLKPNLLSSTKRIKVMTYNVGHYNYGIGAGLPADIYDEKLINWRRFFGEEAPEVVGVQEYDSRMDEEEQIWSDDVLWNYFYPYSEKTGMQTALKTRMPLTDSNHAQLSTGKWYCEGWVGSVYVLSVHLTVGTQHTQTRLDEADEIISTLLAGKDKFIMFGDFNPEPNEETELYKKFTDEGYQLANCGWFGKYYTWSSNREDFDHYENPTGDRIYYLDNIITSANIKITNVYPIPSAYDRLSSDHIPLVAELEI